MSFHDTYPSYTARSWMCRTASHGQYFENMVAPPVSTIGGPGGGVTPLRQYRMSTGAWTAEDDAKLLAARTAGKNWSSIMHNFPGKSSNACRKRHERLREGRGSSHLDVERMCFEYIHMRDGLWKPLAKRFGESWKVVEQQCMGLGLEAMRQAAERYGFEDGQDTIEDSHDTYKDSYQTPSNLKLGDDNGRHVASGAAHHDHTSVMSTRPGSISYADYSHDASSYMTYERYGHWSPR